jgi:large subunit ribosomal protein L16
MFFPAKTKFRKFRKVRVSGHATVCNSVQLGSYGLKVLENVKITSKQIEAVRRVISRTLKRGGVLYIRIFPQLPVTKKPLAVRMGGGKGAVEFWVAPVNMGTVIMEVDNVSEELAIEALTKAKFKLSADCEIVKRRFIYL